MYIACRFVAGAFDTIQFLAQAIIADITTLDERSRFLTDLESKVNIAQAIGPILGGLISRFNLYAAMYIMNGSIIMYRWFAVFLYAVSLIIAIGWLPESIASVIEKDMIIKTFELVNSKRFLSIMNG